MEPWGGGDARSRSWMMKANDFLPSTAHHRIIRAVKAASMDVQSSLVRNAKGMPVDPEVSPAIERPASGGGLRLMRRSRLATACARARIGSRVHPSAMLWGDA